MVGTSNGWKTRKTKYGKSGTKNPKESRLNMSKSHLGEKHSDKQIQKQSESFKKWWSINKLSKIVLDRNKKISDKRKGMLFSDSHKSKLSLAKKGKSWEEIYGDNVEQRRKQQSESLKGHITTKETRRKIRISNVNQVIKSGGPTIGKNETKILNKLEELFKLKIIRQYSVCGYLIDGYIPELNIAIEIDESFHKNQKEKDIIRQNNIVEELGCQFLRIKDK